MSFDLGSRTACSGLPGTRATHTHTTHAPRYTHTTHAPQQDGGCFRQNRLSLSKNKKKRIRFNEAVDAANMAPSSGPPAPQTSLDVDTRRLCKSYLKLLQAVHHKEVVDKAISTKSPPRGMLKQARKLTAFIKPSSPTEEVTAAVEENTWSWLHNNLLILQHHYLNIVRNYEQLAFNDLAFHVATTWASKRYGDRLTRDTIRAARAVLEDVGGPSSALDSLPPTPTEGPSLWRRGRHLDLENKEDFPLLPRPMEVIKPGCDRTVGGEPAAPGMQPAQGEDGDDGGDEQIQLEVVVSPPQPTTSSADTRRPSGDLHLTELATPSCWSSVATSTVLGQPPVKLNMAELTTQGVATASSTENRGGFTSVHPPSEQRNVFRSNVVVDNSQRIAEPPLEGSTLTDDHPLSAFSLQHNTGLQLVRCGRSIHPEVVENSNERVGNPMTTRESNVIIHVAHKGILTPSDPTLTTNDGTTSDLILTGAPDVSRSPSYATGTGELTSIFRPQRAGRFLPIQHRVRGGRKAQEWHFRGRKPVWILGDSNVFRFPAHANPDLQIDSYPGATFYHFQKVLEKTPEHPHVKIVVLSVGINNKDQDPQKTSTKQLRIVYRRAQSVFPNARILIPLINFSLQLTREQQHNLNMINNFIASHFPYLALIAMKDFHTGSDTVHWTKETAQRILLSWCGELQVNLHQA